VALFPRSAIGFGEDDVTPLAEELRHAMSHWPSGVAVLAVKNRGRIEAITVNSFISVSLEPALILVSIAERAQILPELRVGARFAISALSEGQSRVASMVADRVPDLARLFLDGDEPVVRDGLFTLVCTTSQTHEAGDHVLHVAIVDRVIIGRDAAPLFYYGGKYRDSTR
jgi:flavin reductase (DIM6/NTAB) family NADH-FMN oxidoreductase RutF